MSRQKRMMAMLAGLMGSAGFPINEMPAGSGRIPKKMRRKHRTPRYKPAFSMGHRGFPRKLTPVGSIPAPTIDEVRNLERKYGERLHVKESIIYFRDGTQFSKEQAEMRQAQRDFATYD